jgi:N-acetylglucosaminyldiphosphoundecaprenol N-acetyl-beta-D-mannosaminyltransferase
MKIFKNNVSIEIFGIKIVSLTYRELISHIEEFIQEKNTRRIVLLNPHLFLVAKKFSDYMKYIKYSDLVVADGIGIVLTCLLLSGRIVRKITGTDFMPILAKTGAEKGWRFYFLGAKPGVAEKAAENFKKMFPNFNVVGIQHGYFPIDEEKKVVEKIKKAKPDILIVCLGAYKQEMFIEKYQKEIGVPVAFGNGAAFDFWAGEVKRAPRWMQNIGLEWFWRLIQEPKRLWKRYLIGNTIFIFLVIEELIKKIFNKFKLKMGQNSKKCI